MFFFFLFFFFFVFFLMIRPPPRSTRLYTLFPYTTLFRSLFQVLFGFLGHVARVPAVVLARSEEHTSELQSRNDMSYAVFCLKKKNRWRTTTLVSLRSMTASSKSTLTTS